MTTFAATAATMQTLSLAAMEEASRRSRRTADLEDLFLALVINDQPAGHALRTVGITLDRARGAVDELHAAQLGSIGITAGLPAASRIVFHETRGYEWTPRAMDVFKRAGGKSGGDAASVLRELLTEPSGLIDDLLHRLDISPADVLIELENAQSRPAQRGVRSGRNRAMESRAEVFVPAPLDEVWALLADPARMPEWDPNAESVELLDDTGGNSSTPAGTTWLVFASTRRPDGKPLRIKEQFRKRQIELVVASQPDQIAWRTTYPDLKRSNSHLLNAHLTVAPGGTQLQLTSSWTLRGGWRSFIGWPLRPLRHLVMWLTLFQIGGGISRVFR